MSDISLLTITLCLAPKLEKTAGCPGLDERKFTWSWLLFALMNTLITVHGLEIGSLSVNSDVRAVKLITDPTHDVSLTHETRLIIFAGIIHKLAISHGEGEGSLAI